jgi:hypothetical protein
MATLAESLMAHSRLSQTGDGNGNKTRFTNFPSFDEISTSHITDEKENGVDSLSAVKDNRDKTDNPPSTPVPTSGQKWWAAVILCFIFAIIAAPPLYSLTNGVSLYFNGPPLYCNGITLIGLVVHTAIFLLFVRLLLW